MKLKSFENLLANPWFALILIAVTVLVVYSNVYGVPFVFDGKTQIEHNEKIRNLDNYLSLKGFFASRPLVAFSYALNYRFCELGPFGYHLVNNLMHLVNGFLAYFLALQIFHRLSFFPGKRLKNPSGSMVFHGLKNDTEKSERILSQITIPIMALLVALIFVAHPIQTQGVTYTGQRYTSMSAMFYMMSLLSYIWARKCQVQVDKTAQKGTPIEGSFPQKADKNPSRFGPKVLFCYFLSLCTGVFALLCKENAATLFGVVLLVEYFLFDRTWGGWKKKLTWLVPLTFVFASLILYFFATTRGLKFSNLLEDVSILTRETRSIGRWSYLCTQFSVMVIYIRLLFFPAGQNLDYMYPFKEGFFDGATPLAFLFVLTVFLVGVWNIKKRSAVSFGIFWFFITLSIESSIFPISDAMFEHRLYLPLFGFAIVVVYSVFYFFVNRTGWAVLFLFFSVCIVVLSVMTYSRNCVWNDPLVLWSDVVSKNPLNYRARNNLGTLLNNRGDQIAAIREFTEALRLKPDFAFARNNLGSALLRQGRYDEAIVQLREALRLKPNLFGAHNNMGIIMGIRGDLDNAVTYFKKALRISPRSAGTHTNLGTAFLKMGKPDEAILHFRKALEFKPRFSEAQKKLKDAFEMKTKFEGQNK